MTGLAPVLAPLLQPPDRRLFPIVIYLIICRFCMTSCGRWLDCGQRDVIGCRLTCCTPVNFFFSNFSGARVSCFSQNVSTVNVSTTKHHGLAFWFDVLPRSSSHITSLLLFPARPLSMPTYSFWVNTHRVIWLVFPGRSQLSSIIPSHKSPLVQGSLTRKASTSPNVTDILPHTGRSILQSDSCCFSA